jgi:hypothetical protein
MRSVCPWLLVVGATAATESGSACAVAVPLAQGADTTFTVEIDNVSSSDITRAYFESLRPVPWAWSEYTVTTLNSPLCSIGNGSIGLLDSVELSAGPIPAHGSASCSIHVHRTAASLYVLELGFQPSANGPANATLNDEAWIIGPLADLSIVARQAGPIPQPDQRLGFIRVTISNRGPLDVQDADFGYCQDSAAAPFVLDGDVSGGCATATSGPICFGDGLPSVQFGVGALAANETKSCLLRVTANAPLVKPVSFPVYLLEDWQSRSGEFPADPDDSNDVSDLVLTAQVPVAVPAGSILRFLLPCLLLLAVATKKLQDVDAARSRNTVDLARGR